MFYFQIHFFLNLKTHLCLSAYLSCLFVTCLPGWISCPCAVICFLSVSLPACQPSDLRKHRRKVTVSLLNAPLFLCLWDAVERTGVSVSTEGGRWNAGAVGAWTLPAPWVLAVPPSPRTGQAHACASRSLPVLGVAVAPELWKQSHGRVGESTVHPPSWQHLRRSRHDGHCAPCLPVVIGPSQTP